MFHRHIPRLVTTLALAAACAVTLGSSAAADEASTDGVPTRTIAATIFTSSGEIARNAQVVVSTLDEAPPRVAAEGRTDEEGRVSLVLENEANISAQRSTDVMTQTQAVRSVDYVVEAFPRVATADPAAPQAMEYGSAITTLHFVNPALLAPLLEEPYTVYAVMEGLVTSGTNAITVTTSALVSDADANTTTGAAPLPGDVQPAFAAPVTSAGKRSAPSLTRLQDGGAYIVGDRVWEDGNNNGIQDDWEHSGVPYAIVRLYHATTPPSLVSATATSPGGWYWFDVSPSRWYFLEFVPPPNFRLTRHLQPGTGGATEENNSDPDPFSYRTEKFYADEGTHNYSRWDAGMVPLIWGEPWCEVTTTPIPGVQKERFPLDDVYTLEDGTVRAEYTALSGTTYRYGPKVSLPGMSISGGGEIVNQIERGIETGAQPVKAMMVQEYKAEYRHILCYLAYPLGRVESLRVTVDPAAPPYLEKDDIKHPDPRNGSGDWPAIEKGPYMPISSDESFVRWVRTAGYRVGGEIGIEIPIHGVPTKIVLALEFAHQNGSRFTLKFTDATWSKYQRLYRYGDLEDPTRLDPKAYRFTGYRLRDAPHNRCSVHDFDWTSNYLGGGSQPYPVAPYALRTNGLTVVVQTDDPQVSHFATVNPKGTNPISFAPQWLVGESRYDMIFDTLTVNVQYSVYGRNLTMEEGNPAGLIPAEPTATASVGRCGDQRVQPTVDVHAIKRGTSTWQEVEYYTDPASYPACYNGGMRLEMNTSNGATQTKFVAPHVDDFTSVTETATGILMKNGVQPWEGTYGKTYALGDGAYHRSPFTCSQ